MYRVYLLEDYRSYYEDKYGKHVSNLDDETFIDEAEKRGTVYSLKGFEDAFNNENTINNNIDYIRILEVKE